MEIEVKAERQIDAWRAVIHLLENGPNTAEINCHQMAALIAVLADYQEAAWARQN